jgi:hypothetical protein
MRYPPFCIFMGGGLLMADVAPAGMLCVQASAPTGVTIRFAPDAGGRQCLRRQHRGIWT